jgi:hypothetical protein
MSGKLLIEWRHDLCAEITKKRYISDQEMMRVAHSEIVNLFFPLETDESDEINSETSDSKFHPCGLASRNIFMSLDGESDFLMLNLQECSYTQKEEGKNYNKVIFHSNLTFSLSSRQIEKIRERILCDQSL